MRKGLVEVMKAFLAGETKTVGNIRTDGNSVHSYNLEIVTRESYITRVYSVSLSPSKTTTCHIRGVLAFLIDHGVKVEDKIR